MLLIEPRFSAFLFFFFSPLSALSTLFQFATPDTNMIGVAHGLVDVMHRGLFFASIPLPTLSRLAPSSSYLLSSHPLGLSAFVATFSPSTPRRFSLYIPRAFVSFFSFTFLLATFSLSTSLVPFSTLLFLFRDSI